MDLPETKSFRLAEIRDIWIDIYNPINQNLDTD